MKRSLILFLSLLATAVGAIAVTELLLRQQGAARLHAEVRRRPPHPFLQVLPSGQVDHVNEAGFRGDPIEPRKPAGTFRIFTLGGSTTIGVANPYADSYPRLLQTLLQEAYPDRAIEVQNAGSAWYTTAHALIAYQTRVRRYDPDLVIFFEGINDLVRSFSPPWFAVGPFRPDYGHYLGPYTRFRGPEVEFLDAAPRPFGADLLLFRHLRRRLTGEPSPFDNRDPDNVARVAGRMTAIDVPTFRSLASYREYYDLLIRNVQADGHAIIVASQPFLYDDALSEEDRRGLYFAPMFCAEAGQYPNLSSMTRGMRAFNDAAREIATTRGVPLIDVERAVPKTREYFSDDVHLRRAANAILAREMADWIIQRQLIGAAAR